MELSSMTIHIPTLWRSRLPDHCTPTNAFLTQLSQHTGFCIPTWLAALSTLLGCLSMVSWLFAQLPQIYKNYQIKSTAGLSVVFLAEWLLGDATNLTGAILTHQAGWQVMIATYYVFVDVCLVIQHFWYSHLKSKFEDGSVHSRDSTHDDANSEIINTLSPINTTFSALSREDPKTEPVVIFKNSPTRPVLTTRWSAVNYEKPRGQSIESLKSGHSDDSGSGSGSGAGSGSRSGSWSVPASPRTVMFAATMGQLVSQAVAAPIASKSRSTVGALTTGPTTAEFIGTIISWCSTLLYLGSRLPQIYKNYERRSTAGLSPLLFFAAFCGNFFYTTSLLANPRGWNDLGPYGGHGWVGPEGSQRGPYISNTAPFFLGAFGCLGLDITIGVQFMLYGEPEAKLVKVRDSRGFSRWEKVNGWMRGWIPTLAREKVVDMAESVRLLQESREIERLMTNSYGTL